MMKIKLSRSQWESIGRRVGWIKIASHKMSYEGVTIKVMPYDRIEHTDGPWWVWKCEIELPDETVVEGTIEGDGHAWADETLEFDKDPDITGILHKQKKIFEDTFGNE